MGRALCTIVAFILAAAAPVAAQAPAGQPPATPPQAAPAQAAPAPAAPAQPPAAAAQPPQPEAYTYSPDGRRDPFTNLLGSGSVETRGNSMRRGDGPSALAVNDISVRGVMESRGGLVAMIQGPDSKTYVVRQGDRLLDGTIKSITPQGLVITQEVNDPLSLVKQREVSKPLRTLEGVK
jgi:type IV pilus assembly protein PilP